MAHYVQIDERGLVTQVIVADQEFINSGAMGNPAAWVQTSYNTRGGIHYGTDGKPDGKPQLRKNYAGNGYKYDVGRDAFIPKQPFASWTLNEQTCLWDAPTPKPTDGNIYFWDEPTLRWTLSE
jgi:hypothetical protein